MEKKAIIKALYLGVFMTKCRHTPFNNILIRRGVCIHVLNDFQKMHVIICYIVVFQIYHSIYFEALLIC